MIRSYEAEISEDGQVRLLNPLVLRGRHRAVLTILETLDTRRKDTGKSLVFGDGATLLEIW
ncbi:MAG: hypothetical protein HQL93_03690 [Magnetococcales bacterium]|nr:hypothetical protein [Magnetococcales bacterium]